MTNLTFIYLYEAKKLESLIGLNEKLDKLEILYIYNARKLTNYEDVSRTRSLKCLEPRKTGETKSIKFIKDLTALEEVIFGFKVMDGDVSYLEGVKKVGLRSMS